MRRLRGQLASLLVVLVIAAVWWVQSDTDRALDPGSQRGGNSGAAAGERSVDPVTGLRFIARRDLPAEARDVLSRIAAGGPFKYPEHDGKTFNNYEGLLPDKPRGHYREYTVEMRPRVRGPMRLVTGDDGEVFWTEDHYESFARVRR